MAALGRIDKTIHALTCTVIKPNAEEWLHKLNKGKDRHKLAHAVFYSKQGELQQRYREGQGDRFGALDLVINVIVLWNTLHINAAIEQIHKESFLINPQDVTRPFAA